MIATQKLSPDINMIDNSIEYLSECQFSILSWAACGKSEAEIAALLNLDLSRVEKEIDTIVEKMEVNDTESAAILYSLWIDDFEANLQRRNW